MIGILVQLAISWIIIWFVEKKDLSVLGLRPTLPRIADLMIFLAVASACCASGYLLRRYFGNEDWVLNPKLTASLLLDGIWWNIKSVLFEELIFRGVLFYLLIRKLGVTKAILISSIAFGVYHWFSFEILGNPGQMIVVFFITGLVGILYAYGYTQTGSLYATIAMHFGWNFTKGFVFSDGSIGEGILLPVKTGPDVTVSYTIYYLITMLPMVSFLLVNFFLLRLRKKTFTGTEIAEVHI
ncbi:MAG TPA: CPBP family intramembrane glutamic endopeptidase [Chitinophagaceae bacterium]|nr:CPBP family intramembrane glutamic endopeptidase [Chitinophagaceae bacterium]